MKTPVLLLLSFTLTTLCPIAMSGPMMPMQTEHTMAMNVKHNEDNTHLPCERCLQEHEEFAAFTVALYEHVPKIHTTKSVGHATVHQFAIAPVIIAKIPPPDPPAPLVGIVILHT